MVRDFAGRLHPFRRALASLDRHGLCRRCQLCARLCQLARRPHRPFPPCHLRAPSPQSDAFPRSPSQGFWWRFLQFCFPSRLVSGPSRLCRQPQPSSGLCRPAHRRFGPQGRHESGDQRRSQRVAITAKTEIDPQDRPPQPPEDSHSLEPFCPTLFLARKHRLMGLMALCPLHSGLYRLPNDLNCFHTHLSYVLPPLRPHRLYSLDRFLHHSLHSPAPHLHHSW